VRRRLAVTAAAITTTVVLAFCVPLALVVRVTARDRALHGADLESRSLAAVLAGTLDPAVVAPIVGQANAGSTRPASIFLPDGTVLGDTRPAGPELDRARAGSAFTSGVSGGEAVFVPVQTAAGVAVVRVFVPESLLERGVRTAWLVLGLLAVGLVALAVVLADRLGRTLVRPMVDLRDVALRLRGGDREARATSEGPVEVAEVAEALNGLADRIDELVAAEREAAADLSHRLRTPVTALRLDIGRVDDDDERARLTAEVDVLEQTIDDVIRAARAGHANGATASVDLAEAVRVRLAFWSVLGTDQGRAIDVTITDRPCTVGVAKADLEATIDALVGNVFAHTPQGTNARVEVVADDGRPPVLVVEDDGPGIPDSTLAGRGVSGAGSTGLGLDIARRTVERVGGRLVISRSASGGARVALVFGPDASPRRRARLVSERR